MKTKYKNKRNRFISRYYRTEIIKIFSPKHSYVKYDHNLTHTCIIFYKFKKYFNDVVLNDKRNEYT